MTTFVTRISEYDDNSYLRRIHQLNRASVNKSYLPYSAVDWDDPENLIDPNDNVWAREDVSFLTQTEWCRQMPEQTQRQLGLQVIVNSMKMGIFFENILTRGLLAFARGLPDGSPAYRYVMHEAIEETQHSMMFQEFINRSGLSPHSPGWMARWGGFYATQMAKVFPEQFFVFVLGGELPIDYVQRNTLETSPVLHPLQRRIMQIHTTEEARHISFAKLYLQEQVPRLKRWQRRRLEVSTPITLRVMTGMMLKPSSALIQQFSIPTQVIRQAYDFNDEYVAFIKASVQELVELFRELGLLGARNQRLWAGLL